MTDHILSCRCMYFTVPFISILSILHFPVVTSRDRIKLTYLTVFFTIYSGFWLNYVTYHEVFIYESFHTLFIVGYVPFEEYLLFFCQALITTFLHLHTMKFTLPILHIGRFGKSLYQKLVVTYVIPSICLCATCWAWQIAIPDTYTFYLVSKPLMNIFVWLWIYRVPRVFCCVGHYLY